MMMMMIIIIIIILFSNKFKEDFERHGNDWNSIQEIIIGITASSCPLLNYLILIGKVYIWDCRRKCVRPYIEGFILKIKTKYQIEKYIATKNNDLEAFYKKWTGNFPLLV